MIWPGNYTLRKEISKKSNVTWHYLDGSRNFGRPKRENARSARKTSQRKRGGTSIALSLGSKVESTSCQIFSFCILTATGSCIAKIVRVLLPPTNLKGVLKGLSRVRGNSHARFLGEGVSVMGSPYPTTRPKSGRKCKSHRGLGNPGPCPFFAVLSPQG